MDLLHRDVETNSDGNCCGRVQDVVDAGHLKLETTQSLFPVGYVEMADAGFLFLFTFWLTQLDLKVRTTTRAVSHQPPLNLREQAAQERIVIASHHHAIER